MQASTVHESPSPTGSAGQLAPTTSAPLLPLKVTPTADTGGSAGSPAGSPDLGASLQHAQPPASDWRRDGDHCKAADAAQQQGQQQQQQQRYHHHLQQRQQSSGSHDGGQQGSHGSGTAPGGGGGGGSWAPQLHATQGDTALAARHEAAAHGGSAPTQLARLPKLPSLPELLPLADDLEDGEWAPPSTPALPLPLQQAGRAACCPPPHATPLAHVPFPRRLAYNLLLQCPV